MWAREQVVWTTQEIVVKDKNGVRKESSPGGMQGMLWCLPELYKQRVLGSERLD